jgi:hypothetical protein
MLLDISVTLQSAPSSANTTYDAEGYPSAILWTASQTIERANKQPLSGEIVFKEYGISDSGITNLFFLKASTVAQEGGRIVDGVGTYDIYRIEKYGNHCEAIVKPVTG